MKVTKKNTQRGNENGSREQQNIARKPKVKKEKTPAGHIRFNHNFYPVQYINVPTPLYCKACRKENARVAGYFQTEDGKTYYIIKCPWHPNDIKFLEETLFQEEYPNVIPKQETNSGTSKWPVQRSYCNQCKATTAEIIGDVGHKWIVGCTECGASWSEDKESFAIKYIGTENQPPLYRQTTPQPPSSWKDPEEHSPMEALKSFGFSHKATLNFKLSKKEGGKVEKTCEHSAPQKDKKQEELFTVMQIQGITFRLPHGTNASIELIDGKPIISIK